MPEITLKTTKADNTNTAILTPKGEIRVSVRNLVEFILRQGDIDNRHKGSPENAMQEGSRIHRMIQKRMGPDYEAEVGLKYTWETENYILMVEGRADGIIDNQDGIVIDEIKGTYRDLAKMKGPMPQHLAQAKCYAYLYGLKREAKAVRVRMTYCNIESEELKYFYFDYEFAELSRWFGDLVEAYKKWADYTWDWREKRQESIEKLEFPFAYRPGQKELVTHVYSSIYHKKKLFLEAPTGVGKTISTIFPSVKAMGKGMGEKIFYLTAKTITRTVAEDAFGLLRKRGLRFKSVILTAKEKICFMERAECNPEFCPYARGHFDRVNDAIYEILQKEESFTRETIEEYARAHQVCPFELCLDLSAFADGIIGDYNYVFDPHVYLKRFFGDGAGGEYLFLVDEAHNLLERGREMYSAVLVKECFVELKREIKAQITAELSEKKEKKQLDGQMMLDFSGPEDGRGAEEPDGLEEENVAPENVAYFSGKKKRHPNTRSTFVREGYGELIMDRLEACNKELLEMKRECEGCMVVESIGGFTNKLMRLYSAISDYLDEREEAEVPIREDLLDFYFDVGHFLMMYELMDENYVKYTQICEDNTFLLKLFCVNPAKNLKECMLRGRSSILFSATFLPIQYYKSLLGGETDDYEVYARSVFDSGKRGLYIANDVTSKYSRRSEEEFLNIARYVSAIVTKKCGNYMVFCPSHSFMHSVFQAFQGMCLMEQPAGGEAQSFHFAGTLEGMRIKCILQKENMREDEREEFLYEFRKNTEKAGKMEYSLIGFCVLGGIFSEGIDLKKDSLIGAVIVGTGLPQVCFEREILKNYFDEAGENGFDYAYRFPGMNKVLQAAGRVIRTEEDTGVVALLDERFLQASSQRLFPREWENFQTVSLQTVRRSVERFWDGF